MGEGGDRGRVGYAWVIEGEGGVADWPEFGSRRGGNMEFVREAVEVLLPVGVGLVYSLLRCPPMA